MNLWQRIGKSAGGREHNDTPNHQNRRRCAW
jgi:hypothetical protein